MQKKSIYLITGGCGFIGSNFIEMLLKKGNYVVNLDSYSYAANKEINKEFKKSKNYFFFKGNYGNIALVRKIFKKHKIKKMISGILVKVLSIALLIAVGIVLILGIGTLFKGGETSKKYSNKLMQLRVILQFIAIIALVGFAYFFKN